MTRIVVCLSLIMCSFLTHAFSSSLNSSNLLLKISEVKSNKQINVIESYPIEDAKNIIFSDKSVLKDIVKQLKIEDNTFKIVLTTKGLESNGFYGMNLEIPAFLENFKFFVESNKKKYLITLEIKAQNKISSKLLLNLSEIDNSGKTIFLKSYPIAGVNTTFEGVLKDKLKIVELSDCCLKIKALTDHGVFDISTTVDNLDDFEQNKNFAQIILDGKLYILSVSKKY